MKRLKSYNKFNESSLWSKSTIEDLLLDMYDKGVEVSVNVGTWSLLSKSVDYVMVNLGGWDFDGEKSVEFTLESCLLELIYYMEDCGLFLMEGSRWRNDKWQNYVGCPNCLSDDIEDNYNLTMKTKCNNCGCIEPSDSFLLEEWPLDIKVIEEAISTGKKCEQVQLTFSGRKSLYVSDSV